MASWRSAFLESSVARVCPIWELARAEADDAGGVEGGFGGNRQLQGRAVHGRPFVFAGCVLTELHRSWFQARQA